MARGRGQLVGVVEGTYQETRTTLARRLATLLVLGLAIATFAITPATAQASGSWSLDCNGSASGGVSWNWTLNSVPISGAGGSVGCSGTMSATGISARPSDANGFVAEVHVSAGPDANTNTVTKTFDTASSFQVHLSTSANGWVTFCFYRTCYT